MRLRKYRENSEPSRQGNLIILKAPCDDTGERGVLVLKYNGTFEEVPAVFDLPELLKRYWVVLEPSSFRNVESSLFFYGASKASVVVQCNTESDYMVMPKLGMNFTPVRLGAGDWIDSNRFGPATSAEREFDVVMVAAWSRLKRHRVLFRSLAALKSNGCNRRSSVL